MFGPKNGMLHGQTKLDESISVIDPHSLKITGKVPTGQPESHMFSITADGNAHKQPTSAPAPSPRWTLWGRRPLRLSR